MTKAGHTFAGWYKEAAYTNAWNFASDTVNANITLHAKWNQDTVQPLVINIGGINAVLSPANVLTINVDSHVLTPAEITLSATDKAKLVGKNLTVDINKGASTLDTVSLAWVHYLRKALESASPASVDIDTTNLTPVFSSGEWLTDSIDLYSAYKINNKFDSALTNIMNGVKITKDGGDDKCKIIYAKDIKVSDIAIAGSISMKPYPFNTIGLEKEGAANIIPDENIKIHGGKVGSSVYYYDANVDNFASYQIILNSINAYPMQNNACRPDNCIVNIASVGTSSNVAGNGMYDFILAYYNPPANSQEAAPGGSNYYGATEGNKKSLLPQWPASGLTFDGLALPKDSDGNYIIPTRNINGVRLNSMSRKGDARLTGIPETYKSQTGEPREDFIGNLTVLMANYLVSNLYVAEFKNTNIIGDGDQWVSGGQWVIGNGIHVNGNIINLIPTVNIGIIGNYNSMGLNANVKGVLDVKGTIGPNTLPRSTVSSNTHKRSYINLWGDISNETAVETFYVAYMRGSSGGECISGGSSSSVSKTHVLIYSHKYINPLSTGANNNKPYYRAFISSIDGKVKIANPESSNITAEYKGLVTSNSAVAHYTEIPSIDETKWLSAGEAGLDKPDSGSYINYNDLPIDNQLESMDNVAQASASPASLPTRLAAAGRHALEAVLPAKKKSRFEEAFLA
jgi:uncharacterized repeat protein (TIGR02543 family)